MTHLERLVCGASPTYGEVNIIGDASSLHALAELVRSGRGSLDCQRDPDWPIGIDSVVVQDTPSAPASISVDASTAVLKVSGDSERRAVFADNLSDLANDGAPGSHQHVEHFDGHVWLGPESQPLILNRI